jgi:5-hydroxyisourate hydrolase-like protein (transthyretin family)
MSPHTDEGTRTRAAVTRTALAMILCVALGLAGATAPAAANQLTVFSCHDPAGNGVGHDGWAISRTADVDMSLTDSCAAGGQGSLNLELGANPSGYADAARAEWQFSAPPWGSIASYKIAVVGSYAVPGTGAGMGQNFVNASDESDPNYDYRNLGSAAQGAYTISRTPPTNPTVVVLNASCDGQSGRCASNSVVSRLAVSATAILVNDPTTPTVTELSGALVSGTPLTGSVDASFDAADSGPGVYSARLVIDGAAQPAVILDANNGWCVNQGQTSDGTRSFDHPSPCPPHTSGTTILDSTGVPDGLHTLKLIVDDASGNSTTAYNATLTTRNAPVGSRAPAIATEAGAAGSVLTADPGAWTAPGGAGAISYGYEWQQCDVQGNACEAIPGAGGASYTVAAANTGHTLRVKVTASDNDGLTAATSNATGVAGVTGQPAASLGTAIVGTPNGSGANRSARIMLSTPTSIQRAYARRAITIGGRLTQAAGQPIANATLEVLQQAGDSSRAQAIGQARTDSNGTFTLAVPPSASRSIQIAYRAFSGDPSWAATATVREGVAAGVVLNVSPRHTSSRGTITLSGRVYGAPRRGVIVALLVFYRGHWEPFRTPRTNSTGRFSVAYQFQGANGRFPFRAEVLAGQAGYPYEQGYSRPVSVLTR